MKKITLRVSRCSIYTTSLILLLLLTSVSLAGDTLGYFKDRIDERLGSFSSYVADDTTKEKAVNDGIRAVTDFVGGQVPCIVKICTLYIDLDTTIYGVASDCYKVLEVYPYDYEKTDRPPLQHVGIGDLRKSTGATAKLEQWTQIATDSALIKVAPPLTAETDTIVVIYNAYPTALTLDSATSLLPREFTSSAVDYGTHLCWEKMQNFPEADRMLLKFYNRLNILINILKAEPYDLLWKPKIFDENE